MHFAVHFVITRLTNSILKELKVIAKCLLSICNLLLEKLEQYLDDTNIERICKIIQLLHRPILIAPPMVTRDRIEPAIVPTEID